MPGIVSTLYAVYHPKETTSPQYVDYYFSNDLRLNKYLKPLVNIGAKHDMKINNEFALTGNVAFPGVCEQREIAEFLSKFDSRIAKQRDYIEALKKYKRGLIKQLLTRKVAFSNSATWHTDRIGNLGTFIKGAPLSKADIADDGQPFILYGELYTTYNEVITLVKRKTHAQVDGCYYSRPGDVIIPTSGETPEEISTASCVMVPNVILAGDLNIFRSDIIDGRIMSYLLNHIVNRKIARVAQGKSVVHVQAGDLAEIEVTYPDTLTQQKMADMFDTINKKVDNEEKKLEYLQQSKKGLLQQLFI